MIGEIIVEKIRQKSKQKNLSIYELSKRSNVKYSTLSSLLCSERPNPTLETVYKISLGLNCSMKDFFDEDMFFKA